MPEPDGASRGGSGPRASPAEPSPPPTPKPLDPFLNRSGPRPAMDAARSRPGLPLPCPPIREGRLGAGVSGPIRGREAPGAGVSGEAGATRSRGGRALDLALVALVPVVIAI